LRQRDGLQGIVTLPGAREKRRQRECRNVLKAIRRSPMRHRGGKAVAAKPASINGKQVEVYLEREI